MRSGFAWTSPYALAPGQPTPGFTYPPASLHRWTTDRWVGRPRRAFLSKRCSSWARMWWYGNINPLSIDYAFRPRLRSRLTLGGRAFPRNPWTFGGGDSHSPFATHAYILARVASTAGSRRRFDGHSTLLYRSCTRQKPAASVLCLAPLHFPRGITRPVSCYALFKGWLLLSQPPGCLGNSTSFPT